MKAKKGKGKIDKGALKKMGAAPVPGKMGPGKAKVAKGLPKC